MEDQKHIIAIDFDSTLTMNHNFPDIGEPRMWLIKKAIEWRKKGHTLLLWTCREDISPEEKAFWPARNYLTEAVEWCRGFGLEFDAVNKSVEEITYPDFKFGRKVFAKYYIDDSSVCFDDKNQSFHYYGTIDIE